MIHPTIPLHQKILYPVNSPTNTPKVLHSTSSLDQLILDLIALSLRAFVVPWYNGGISRDPDKEFLQAVTGILVHVVQSLELRMGSVDWEGVILREVPALLEIHYRDWDLAEMKAEGSSLSTSEIFHSLHPNLAVSLESSTRAPIVDPVYLRTLVGHLLKLLLPPEDYRAETERFITREVVGGVVFGSVFGKVAQPWFLHGVLARVLEGREVMKDSKEEQSTSSDSSSSFLSTSSRILETLSSILTSTIGWLFSPRISDSQLEATSSLPPVHLQLLSLLLAILPQSTTLTHLSHYISLPLSLASRSLDALFYRSITNSLRSEQTVRSILEGIIRGMFPNNGYPSSKEPDPDEAMQEELQRSCEEAIAKLIPGELFRISPVTLTFIVLNLPLRLHS